MSVVYQKSRNENQLSCTIYIDAISCRIQSRHAINFKGVVIPKTRSLWEHLMQPEADPPVPPGATKFSYSVR